MNSTIAEIQAFRTSSLNSLTRSFNSLRDDVYGHFFRSQTTLRIARMQLFSTASKFPYYLLSNTTRVQLVNRLSYIINNCTDPTIDYLQKDSMLRYSNFMGLTPIETALEPLTSQLELLETALRAVNDSDCFSKLTVINQRRLNADFSPFTNAVGDCIRVANQQYRQPINEFTRVHFIALPLINRINNDLSQCANIQNANRREPCVTSNFLEKYCEDDSKCPYCSTM